MSDETRRVPRYDDPPVKAIMEAKAAAEHRMKEMSGCAESEPDYIRQYNAMTSLARYMRNHLATIVSRSDLLAPKSTPMHFLGMPWSCYKDMVDLLEWVEFHPCREIPIPTPIPASFVQPYTRRPINVEAVQWDGSEASMKALQEFGPVVMVGSAYGHIGSPEVATMRGAIVMARGEYMVRFFPYAGGDMQYDVVPQHAFEREYRIAGGLFGGDIEVSKTNQWDAQQVKAREAAGRAVFDNDYRPQLREDQAKSTDKY